MAHQSGTRLQQLFHVRDCLNAFEFQITELSPEDIFNIGIPNEGAGAAGRIPIPAE